jgi:hypothetical protein
MVTATEIIQEVRRLAAERPDYVYDEGEEPEGGDSIRCFYWKDDRPSCIFGHALFRLGVTPERLQAADAVAPVGDSIESLLNRLAVGETPTETQWMGTVQRRQDDGWAWGEAVAATDREISLTV